MTYPMITAREAIAQGSTPSLFFSIAKFTKDQSVASVARERGREMAGIIGMDLGGRRNKKPANDNRRQHVAAASRKRRAA